MIAFWVKKNLRIYLLRAEMIAGRLSGKRSVILDIEELSFIPHFVPLVKSLNKKTKQINYYIATHYPHAKEFDELEIENKEFIPVTYSKQLHEADAFISSHIYGVGSSKSYRIHINHNQPVKYQSYMKRDFVNFDAHFLTSPLHREQTELTINNYGLESNAIDLYDIGYAKSDELLNGAYERSAVLRQLGFDSDNPVVLYAPSWDEGLSLRTIGKEVISSLLSIEGINVIAKLHPISYCRPDGPNYEFYTGGIDWIRELREFEKFKNFRHPPVSNIDPLLAASDVMVTDVSSVALEFIMLDKPVVYIDCPVFFEKTLAEVYSGFGNTTPEFVKNDPKANAGRHTGIVAANVREIKDAVLRSLEKPDEFSQKRKELALKLSYNPGNAADAGAGQLLKILKLEIENHN